MADKSITGLTAAGTITGAELVKVVQGGNSRKAALSAIIAALAPVGIDGVDGRTVLNGTTVPSGGLGVDGDFYIRTTNYVIYGPKTAGDWGSGVSLVGPPGADGADGADGLDGTDGQSLLNGSGAPAGGLGNDGDMYLDYTNYDVYGPKTAGAWGSGTSILGTVGSDGKTILNGAVDPTTEGTDGDFYINTSTTTIFGPKAGGVWPAGISLIGADGLDGVDGVDGRTVLYGTAAPTTEGVDGDFYIRTTTNFIYGPKAAGVWPAGISLVGPAGEDGLDGTDGTDGNSVRSGTGAPAGGLGVDGDFYIDTAAMAFYGPKTAGAWGSPSNIITGALPYDIRLGFNSVPTTDQIIDTIPIVRDWTLPANMSGSVGYIDVDPTATFVLDLKDDGTTIGTISISTLGVFTFATTSGTEKVIAAGSLLTFVAPTVVDATANRASITLKGSV